MGHYASEMDGSPGPNHKPPAIGPKDPRDVILDLVEGGLLLLLDAVKADDSKAEIIWRIEEELRQVRCRA
jgi:hypothetical protein